VLTQIDLDVLLRLVRSPRIPVRELAKDVGVARNTAQARMERLTRDGIIQGGHRDVNLRRAGFAVGAFMTIEVEHNVLDTTVAALGAEPNVLQVLEVTGGGDLLCEVAVRDTDELQTVVHRLHGIAGVRRTTTWVVLGERVPYRIDALLEDAGRD
jgi:DNA-binding Lrp family transcriptional regulator